MGILGGTFNPPHLGHLAIARDARDELGLDPVLLIPANISPDKVSAEDPGCAHRLRMCELLVANASGLSACALEIERGGRSYTVDTLEAIHASNPDAELTFIVGADAVRTLPAWRRGATLLELADLAVATRGASGRQEVLDVVAQLTGELTAEQVGPAVRAPARVSFLRTPLIAISSSIVRGRVARGEAIDDLVGGAVASYIAEQRLYRSPPQAGG